MTRPLVLAGQHREFLSYCELRKFNIQDCVYIDSPEKLMGRSGGQRLTIIGTALNRRDFSEFINIALSYRMEIIYADDW